MQFFILIVDENDAHWWANPNLENIFILKSISKRKEFFVYYSKIYTPCSDQLQNGPHPTHRFRRTVCETTTIRFNCKRWKDKNTLNNYDNLPTALKLFHCCIRFNIWANWYWSDLDLAVTLRSWYLVIR